MSTGGGCQLEGVNWVHGGAPRRCAPPLRGNLIPVSMDNATSMAYESCGAVRSPPLTRLAR